MTFEFFPQDSRHYVQFEFEARKKRRPQYSLRAFARDLEISPSALSEYLSGKLTFSKERVQLLSKKIILKNEQVDHWLDLVTQETSPSKADREVAAVKIKARLKQSSGNLNLDLFNVVSDWYHFALLELIDVAPKYQDPKEAAEALGLDSKTVKESWDRLIHVGLAEKVDGLYRAATLATVVGEEIPSQALRNYHSGLIQKSLMAQEDQPVDKKLFMSIVFSYNSQDLKAIKDEIDKFHIDLTNRYSQKKNKDSVYCLSLQLFDLVQEKKV